MSSNPFITAAKAKGLSAVSRRAYSIAGRYGLTPIQMETSLERFAQVLDRFGCGATFPVTAVTLQRHYSRIARFLERGIEFAVHGYTHVDYARLSDDEQRTHLENARQVFLQAGVMPVGFRSPYLSRDARLNIALQEAGFSYVSNQPILWDVVDLAALDDQASAGYERAAIYYQPWQAQEQQSLPRMANSLVEIPVSLPDDEILIERLGAANGMVGDVWRRILAQTYQRGELFTLQLHPERIGLCADGLADVLADARAHTPAVWCARLCEVAEWWKARSQASLVLSAAGNCSFRIQVAAPPEAVVLIRAVEVDAQTEPWSDGYRKLKSREFCVRSEKRPVIGLTHATSPEVGAFLRRQGYIVETGAGQNDCACVIDRPVFSSADEPGLLKQIEDGDFPLLRLGRWPNGARSALAITGDVDAMTLWDYGLRLVGK